MLKKVKNCFKAGSHFSSKKLLSLSVLATALFTGSAMATTGDGGLGNVASSLTSNLISVVLLVTVVMAIAGLSFIVIGLLKARQHSINPTQVPLTHGLTAIVVGVCLLLAPALVNSIGVSAFGDKASAGMSSFGAKNQLNNLLGVPTK